jgi:two-component system sensor histidine kinase MprB
VAAAGAVILVSVVAFFIVRQNILASLDANLLQRATAAAQSELVDPQQLASTQTGALGAGDIRLALLYDNGRAQSARGAVTAPPLGEEELAVARGEVASSVRTATDGRVQYRVVAVDEGEGRALVIG